MYWKLYNIVRLNGNKQEMWQSFFWNIRSVSPGIDSGNEVSNMQRTIINHLNFPVSVDPCISYNKILNNIAQSIIEVAGEFIDKATS